MDVLAGPAPWSCYRGQDYQDALRAYLGDEYCGARIHVEVDVGEEFDASIQPVRIGAIGGAVHTTHGPHRLEIGASGLGPQDIDLYLVLQGQLRLEHRAGSATLLPGQLGFVASASALYSESMRMQMVAVTLPGGLLSGDVCEELLGRGYLPDFPAVCQCLGALLVRATAPGCEPDPVEHDLLQGIILSSVRSLARHATAANGTATVVLDRLDEFKRLARRRLAEPGLSAECLAEAAGLSLRSLHRLFHASGSSFRSWLRDERLARCWEDLFEFPQTQRTIAATAFRWGFNDLTTFNRAFREKYGMAPSELRRRRS